MNYQLTILQALNRVQSRMLTNGALWTEVVTEISGANYTAFRAALVELEQKGQIVVITGEDRNHAKITDAGRARLAELNA